MAIPPLSPSAAIPAQQSRGPARKDICLASLHNAWDEHTREMTLEALVTAGSCGQMFVTGLLPLPAHGWMIGYAERCSRKKPMPGIGSNCSLAFDSSMPKCKHGMADRHASVLCCWAEGTREHGLNKDNIDTAKPLSLKARQECIE
ncbi:hypothetical protein J3F83DRAFT_738877 [Trichoderma novae-zelandiae]